MLIGLRFLRKTLGLLGFEDKVIAITILLLGLGTNLLAYSSQSATMPHVYGFCLFSGFIYNTLKWHESFKFKRLVYIGLIFGLISLIRPSNGVIALFFLFYDVVQFSDIKQRIILIKNHFFSLLIIPLLAIIIWFPQLWYWKIVSGDFFYYGYRDEGFYFLDPYILEGLFGFRKGWLVYTPMMIFALLGLFFLKNKAKTTRWSIIVFMMANIYVIFSWWCWWYGGTFGQRSLIESYAILAIPLAALIAAIKGRKMWLKIVFLISTLFFIWLNIFQTYQFENQSLHHDSMTKELYFKQFGSMHQKTDFYNFLDPADYKGMLFRNGTPSEKKIKREKDFFIDKDILLISNNGLYLVANRNKGDTLFADSGNPWEWETFRIERLNGASFAIKASNNKYISVDLNNKTGSLTATSLTVRGGETFTIEYLENEKFAIKAVNGKYLSVAKNGLIIASAEKLGEKEAFEMIIK